MENISEIDEKGNITTFGCGCCCGSYEKESDGIYRDGRRELTIEDFNAYKEWLLKQTYLTDKIIMELKR